MKAGKTTWTHSFRLSVSVLCYTVSPAGCNKTATPPTLSLIRIYPPCLWASFHSLFQQPSELSHINHSHHTIRLTTRTFIPTFSRKTDTCEGDLCCPSDVCSGNEHTQSLLSIEHCIKSSVIAPQCPGHLRSLHTVLRSCSSVHRLIEQGHVRNRQGYRKLNRFTCSS